MVPSPFAKSDFLFPTASWKFLRHLLYAHGQQGLKSGAPTLPADGAVQFRAKSEALWFGLTDGRAGPSTALIFQTCLF